MPSKAFRGAERVLRKPTLAKASAAAVGGDLWTWLVLNVLRIPTDVSEKQEGAIAYKLTSQGVEIDTNNVAANKSHVSDHSSAWKKKMAVRVAAGIVMAAIMTLVVASGHLAVCALVIAVQFAIFGELVSLRFTVAKHKCIEGPMFRTVQWGWFVTAMVHSYSSTWLKAPLGGQQYLAKLHEWSLGGAGGAGANAYTNASPNAVVEAIAVAMYSIMLVVTVLSFKAGLYQQQISQLSWTALILLAVVFQLKATVYSIYSGLYFLIFPASLVIANDTFAYFCGMAFGKKFVKQPFMALSPSKTWEGFVGAFIMTMAYAYMTANVWGGSPSMRCSFPELSEAAGYPATCASDKYFAVGSDGDRDGGGDGNVSRAQMVALGLALFASLIAPFGGFFASAVKRATSVKDFAGYIPGHGGFTDRMDCQLIMAVAGWAVYALCMPQAASQVGNFKYAAEAGSFVHVNGSA